MTPLAVVAWAAHSWPAVQQSALAFMAAPAAGVRVHRAGCRRADRRQAAVRSEPVDAWPAGRPGGLGRTLRRGVCAAAPQSLDRAGLAAAIGGIAGSFGGPRGDADFTVTVSCPTCRSHSARTLSRLPLRCSPFRESDGRAGVQAQPASALRRSRPATPDTLDRCQHGLTPASVTVGALCAPSPLATPR